MLFDKKKLKDILYVFLFKTISLDCIKCRGFVFWFSEAVNINESKYNLVWHVIFLNYIIDIWRNIEKKVYSQKSFSRQQIRYFGFGVH